MITGQIFIAGCARSGTTLLGSMLGAHPKAVSTPESHFVPTAYQRFDGDLAAAWAYITSHWRFKIWETPVDDMPPDVQTYPDLLNTLVGLYAERVGRAGASLWVDHTPKHIKYAVTLLDLFPQAKFIHLVRDGRAVAASVMPLDWGPNTIFRAAHWWVEYMSYGLALEHQQPERVLRVHYEDLVTEPVEALHRLCDFLDLAYHPAMRDAAGFSVPGYTAIQHALVGQKPDPTRATRWKQTLSRRQIELFEHATRDYLRLVGYTLEYGADAAPPTLVEQALGGVVEAYRWSFGNRLRWLRRGIKVVTR